MSIREFIENYIFKKRYIINYNLKDTFKDDINISYLEMSNNDLSAIPYTMDKRLANFLKARERNSSWVFFYYHNHNEILGYSFLHIPSEVEWNDSLPTLPGEARLSSNYVYPKYRGQGVRGAICKQQINYAKKNNLNLWCVIERSNTASLRAESKFDIYKKFNYLIKIYSYNIISIKTNPIQLFILLGDKRARR